MSQSPYSRPWAAPGVGWLFAVIVLIVWVLVLLHVLPSSESLVPLSFVALSLALLL